MSAITVTLASIQKNVKSPKARVNTFGGFHYRSCEDILREAKPYLGGATITLSDEVVLIGDRYYVKATATLTGENGETVACTSYAREQVEKKGMDMAQVTGSASSYARKYALSGLFALDDEQDPDALPAEEGEKGRGDRQNAQQGRQNAQQGRQNAQQGRQNAPQGRQNAQQGRQNAPQGRQNAQQGRQNAQQGRQNAQHGSMPGKPPELASDEQVMRIQSLFEALKILDSQERIGRLNAWLAKNNLAAVSSANELRHSQANSLIMVLEKQLSAQQDSPIPPAANMTEGAAHAQ